MQRMKITKPSQNIVKKYLEKWDSLKNYVLQESSLRKLFTETYPENTKMDDVLIKVCSLNDFYSTYIFSPFKVAEHIVSLKIDKRLKQNDLTLVNSIANIKIKGKKRINFYSFATKYCSHHKPEIYPIYDYYVERIISHFKKTEGFCKFIKKDFKDYQKYRNILINFQIYFGLTRYTLKEIDKYLWQAGKEYFPRKYT
jgi:hypothetical protein